MRTVVLIVGLPGSGKTFFAHENFPDAVIIDDPRDFGADLPDDFPGTMVITDPHLCRVEILKVAVPMLMARYDILKVGLVFFENDPDAAKANARLRNDGRLVEDFIDILTKVYNPPADAQPIWRMN